MYGKLFRRWRSALRYIPKGHARGRSPLRSCNTIRHDALPQIPTVRLACERALAYWLRSQGYVSSKVWTLNVEGTLRWYTVGGMRCPGLGKSDTPNPVIILSWPFHLIIKLSFRTKAAFTTGKCFTLAAGTMYFALPTVLPPPRHPNKS